MGDSPAAATRQSSRQQASSEKSRSRRIEDRASDLAVSLFLAAIGYLTTALHSLRAQQHRARVDRVNEQLKALYGPLLACVTASKSAYEAMLRQAKFSTNREFRAAVRADPDGPAAKQYRTWVREGLMPLSERAARSVQERADLLEGSDISPLLLQLVSHVSAYKVILRRWDQGEKAESSVVHYPEELEQWVSEGFLLLKQRQARLLGLNKKGDATNPIMRFITARL